ncbi:hypothetical protein [Cellulosimicrobium sp. CUA-896]|uniref:hypothetical protein n=1 Tax=Cellulosimicrobium sp. CUA-896 TaxID=1517881 RepID=UPI000960F821|nr:hypothetical protein [Cellulosimicrobium sp. CUA-896]OLT54353.1 hypothetical protein BJF88_09485 [Cellulosimicrobium sp. CUA-896]
MSAGTPTGPARVSRLPVRSVLVELPQSPGAVESPPVALPDPAPLAFWRRWSWAVAFVPTVGLVVYQRLAPGRGWPVPDAVVVAATLGLLVTALLALVRYLDDRGAAALARGRRAVLDAPVQATATFTPAPARGAASAGADPAGSVPDVTGSARTEDGTLTVVPTSGTPLARPVRVTVPAGVAGPRPGDPLAVWHAADDEDATGVLLVRYHRTWADDVLDAMRPPADGADADADA